jgi:hypothetical protein
MKSLEVTLFLNQTPADGVASVIKELFVLYGIASGNFMARVASL